MVHRPPIIITTQDDVAHGITTAISLLQGRGQLGGAYDIDHIQILMVPCAPVKTARTDDPHCKRTPIYLPTLADSREHMRQLGDFLEDIEDFMLLEPVKALYAIDPGAFANIERERVFLRSPLGGDPVRVPNAVAREQLGSAYRDDYNYYNGVFLKVVPERIAFDLAKRLREAQGRIRVFKLAEDAKLVASGTGFAIETASGMTDLGATIVASGIRSLDIVEALPKSPLSKDVWVCRQIRHYDGLPTEQFVYTIAEHIGDRVKFQIVNDCPAGIARQIEESVRDTPPVTPLRLEQTGSLAVATAPAMDLDIVDVYRLPTKLIVDGRRVARVFAMSDSPVICAQLSDIARQIAARGRVVQLAGDKDWMSTWRKSLSTVPALASVAGAEEATAVQIFANTCIGCINNGK